MVWALPGCQASICPCVPLLQRVCLVSHPAPLSGPIFVVRYEGVQPPALPQSGQGGDGLSVGQGRVVQRPLTDFHSLSVALEVDILSWGIFSEEHMKVDTASHQPQMGS